jgi:hypothetical protein
MVDRKPLAVRAVCPSTINYQPSTNSGLWCNSSISACEADGPGANPGFLTIQRKEKKKEKRDERSRRLAFSASGILLNEQSTPRHNDLNAGIWIRAVRRVQYRSHFYRGKATRSYSQL